MPDHLKPLPSHPPVEGETPLFPEFAAAPEKSEEEIVALEVAARLQELSESNEQRLRRLAQLHNLQISPADFVAARLDALTELLQIAGPMALLLEMVTAQNVAKVLDAAEQSVTTNRLITP